MDQIYLWIIILFAVILILDFSERWMKNKKVEHFDDLYDYKDPLYEPSNSTNFPPYYEENRLNVYEPPYSTNAINFSTNASQGSIQFSNFTTNGLTPPFVKCNSCDLQFDCTNYPYNSSDKNGNVCTKCFEKVYMDNNNMPVFARSVGKPRTCRKLVNDKS